MLESPKRREFSIFQKCIWTLAAMWVNLIIGKEEWTEEDEIWGGILDLLCQSQVN